jgi:hypothetical protein
MSNTTIKHSYNPELANRALYAQYTELHQKLDHLIKLVETLIPQETKEAQADETT